MIGSKVELVQLIGVMVFIVEIVLLSWLVFKGKVISNTVKWMSLIALIIGPILMVTLGNFYVFDHSKSVEACGSCHVMKPMVTDLQDKESMTLAARHYKNKWIVKNECYSCHKEYGLNGGILSKMTGYRHLMRYVTGAHDEPIAARTDFNYKNCLSCHSEETSYAKVDMHKPLLDKFANNEVSCLNCHGRAHPSRLQRTPGSEDYERLMTTKPADADVVEYLNSLSENVEPK